jgi:hypothetical protein
MFAWGWFGACVREVDVMNDLAPFHYTARKALRKSTRVAHRARVHPRPGGDEEVQCVPSRTAAERPSTYAFER